MAEAEWQHQRRGEHAAEQSLRPMHFRSLPFRSLLFLSIHISTSPPVSAIPWQKLRGNTSAVESTLLSRSEDQAISGVFSGSVKLWDLNEGKAKLWDLNEGSALLSRSEDQGFSGVLSGSVKLWDLNEGKGGSEDQAIPGVLSGSVKLWDLNEGKAVRTLTGHRGSALSLDFHPFEPFFASGSQDSTARVWDPRQKEAVHTLKNHGKGVACVRFSPDGQWLMTGGQDSVIKVRWGRGKEGGKIGIEGRRQRYAVHTLKNRGRGVACVRFSPDGQWLMTGGQDSVIKLWVVQAGKVLHEFKHHHGAITCPCLTFHSLLLSLCLHPYPHLSPAAVGRAGGQGAARLWDVQAGKVLHEFKHHHDAVTCLTFHPHELLLASLCALYCPSKHRHDAVTCLTLHPHELLLASCQCCPLPLWLLRVCALYCPSKHRHDAVTCLTLHPHELLLASCQCCPLPLCLLRVCALYCPSKHRHDAVTCLTLHPHELLLASCQCCPLPLCLLRVCALFCPSKHRHDAVTCLTLHPHELLLASCQFRPSLLPLAYMPAVSACSSDRTCKFWDLETFELVGSTGTEVCSSDRTCKFWDLETFELVGSTGTEANGMRSLAFTPDGQALLAPSADSLKASGMRSLAFTPDGQALLAPSADSLKVRRPQAGRVEMLSAACSLCRLAQGVGVVWEPVRCFDTVSVWGWELVRCFDTVSVGWSKVATDTPHSHPILFTSFDLSSPLSTTSPPIRRCGDGSPCAASTRSARSGPRSLGTRLISTPSSSPPFTSLHHVTLSSSLSTYSPLSAGVGEGACALLRHCQCGMVDGARNTTLSLPILPTSLHLTPPLHVLSSSHPLQVWGWEPVRCFDTVSVGWSKVADVSIHDGRLYGASFSHTCVSLWHVDLMQVAPFGSSASESTEEERSLSGTTMGLPLPASPTTSTVSSTVSSVSTPVHSRAPCFQGGCLSVGLYLFLPLPASPTTSLISSTVSSVSTPVHSAATARAPCLQGGSIFESTQKSAATARAPCVQGGSIFESTQKSAATARAPIGAAGGGGGMGRGGGVGGGGAGGAAGGGGAGGAAGGSFKEVGARGGRRASVSGDYAISKGEDSSSSARRGEGAFGKGTREEAQGVRSQNPFETSHKIPRENPSGSHKIQAFLDAGGVVVDTTARPARHRVGEDDGDGRLNGSDVGGGHQSRKIQEFLEAGGVTGAVIAHSARRGVGDDGDGRLNGRLNGSDVGGGHQSHKIQEFLDAGGVTAASAAAGGGAAAATGAAAAAAVATDRSNKGNHACAGADSSASTAPGVDTSAKAAAGVDSDATVTPTAAASVPTQVQPAGVSRGTTQAGASASSTGTGVPASGAPPGVSGAGGILGGMSGFGVTFDWSRAVATAGGGAGSRAATVVEAMNKVSDWIGSFSGLEDSLGGGGGGRRAVGYGGERGEAGGEGNGVGNEEGRGEERRGGSEGSGEGRGAGVQRVGSGQISGWSEDEEGEGEGNGGERKSDGAAASDGGVASGGAAVRRATVGGKASVPSLRAPYALDGEGERKEEKKREEGGEKADMHRSGQGEEEHSTTLEWSRSEDDKYKIRPSILHPPYAVEVEEGGVEGTAGGDRRGGSDSMRRHGSAGERVRECEDRGIGLVASASASASLPAGGVVREDACRVYGGARGGACESAVLASSSLAYSPSASSPISSSALSCRAEVGADRRVGAGEGVGGERVGGDAGGGGGAGDLIPAGTGPSLPSQQQKRQEEEGGDEEDDEMVVMENPSLPLKQQKRQEEEEGEEDDEMVVMESVNGRHTAMQHMLQGRLSAVRHVAALWVDGELLPALSALAASKDLAVVADVLEVLVMQGGRRLVSVVADVLEVLVMQGDRRLVSVVADVLEVLAMQGGRRLVSVGMEGALQLQPLLRALLASSHSKYVGVALSLLRELLRAFSEPITAARTATHSPGVDLHMEERLQRCNDCYEGFRVLEDQLHPILRRRSNENYALASDVHMLLQKMQ
ncbi:unnamed protein product [Closterium sp. NIES-65]|nr:unnamed protein product [Closterium sp. NIES-65]